MRIVTARHAPVRQTTGVGGMAGGQPILGVSPFEDSPAVLRLR
jgi:hypothetical protein